MFYRTEVRLTTCFSSILRGGVRPLCLSTLLAAKSKFSAPSNINHFITQTNWGDRL